MATRYTFKTEFLENIIESLQCFKCKDVPGFDEKQKNRYNCIDNSHQVCEKCKDLGKCACGSLFSNNPNPIARQILKDMLVYCPHYKRGCRETFARSEDLNYHQQGCVFRQVYCPILHCESKEKLQGRVMFKDVIDHLKQHTSRNLGNFSFNDAKQINYVAKVWTKRIGPTCYWAWQKVQIKIANGTIFFLAGKAVNKLAYFWLYSLLSPLETKNYAYTISITDKNEAKFTFRDKVKALDEAADDIIDKQYVFVIGTEIIKEIVTVDGKLAIQVTIHDLKEEAKDEDVESGVEDEPE